MIGRATALLPEKDARHRELLCELGVALRAAGQWERAIHVLEEAVLPNADKITAALRKLAEY